MLDKCKVDGLGGERARERKTETEKEKDTERQGERERDYDVFPGFPLGALGVFKSRALRGVWFGACALE